jgi:predicted nucleotidyltransferase
MDFRDPTQSITPTLDGPVLAVLATSPRPLTVGQLASEAARGSEIGVRKCLARLVEQGVVRSTTVGRNRVHELNRDHVAAEAVLHMSDLRGALWKRMRTDIKSWSPRPLFASVFGSAARGDASVASDIDVVVVHRPFPGDPKPPKRRSLPELLSAVLFAPVEVSSRDVDRWQARADGLHMKVESWTGNHLHLVDLSMVEWLFKVRESRLGIEIERDGITLAGFPDLYPQIATARPTRS